MPWQWTKAEEEAFEEIKRAIVSNPVLRFFDPQLPVTVQTDASSTGLRAVYSSYLRLTATELVEAAAQNRDIPGEARQIIEYGENRDGYWTCDKFLAQVEHAVAIAEFK